MAKNSGRDRAMLAEVLHPNVEARTPLLLASVSRFACTSKAG
jgi:hypothetical protein